MEVLPTIHTTSTVKTGADPKVKKIQWIYKNLSSTKILKVINTGVLKNPCQT